MNTELPLGGGGGTGVGKWKSVDDEWLSPDPSSSLTGLLKGAGGSGLDTAALSSTPDVAGEAAAAMESSARRSSGEETGASGGKQTKLGEVNSGVVEPVRWKQKRLNDELIV